MTSPTIEIKPCSFEAAKYAVMNWHYSKAMPSGKLVKFGVWEDGKFIGAVVYGRGANPSVGEQFGLSQFEICELVRVALTTHQTPVSQIVSKTLKMLKQTNTGMRLVVSYADPSQGHKGGIYRAGNWLYVGSTVPIRYFIINGKKTHTRSANGSLAWARANKDPNTKVIMTPPKLRFVYPLDKQARRKYAKLVQEFPTAIEGLEESRLDSIEEVQVQSLPIAQAKAKKS